MKRNRLQDSLLVSGLSQMLTKGTDNSFNVFDLSSQEGKELNGHSAVMNALEMWIRSLPYDYIYEPTVGGVLCNLVGNGRYKLCAENEPIIQQIIQEQISEVWSDITVQSITVTANLKQRKWDINMTVVDNTTNLASTVTTLLDS